MQSMLAQLAAEREERARANKEPAHVDLRASDAADSNTAHEASQAPDGGSPQTPGRKKSRKQANPVRFAGGAARFGRERVDEGEISSKSAETKGSGSKKTETKPKRTAKNPEGDDEGGSEGKPAKKRKRPAAAPAPSSGEFVAPSSLFDASEIAGSFIADDFREGRGSLGEVAQDTFTSAARLHSLDTGKAKIVDADDEGKGGLPEIVVTFRGNNRKAYQDRCPLYTREQAAAIIHEVLSRNRGTKRRAASYKHLLSAQELSSRMPPLLWSLYRCSKDVDSLLRKLVAEHEAGGAGGGEGGAGGAGSGAGGAGGGGGGGGGGGRGGRSQPVVYTLDCDSD